ncbi:MAG: type II toxin-antitoxin system PemK/MazF family toxin [Candidatus Paceibacterota bacterium]
MDEEFKKILAEFVKWVKVKVRIHIADNLNLSYKQRDIWWANVGLNVGSEQNGKDEEFQRPVLVLRKFGQHIFWAIPLTSQKKDNKYHIEIKYKEYYENIVGELISEDKEGRIILNQLKTMSSKRLIRKIGVMSEEDFNVIREKIKNVI